MGNFGFVGKAISHDILAIQKYNASSVSLEQSRFKLTFHSVVHATKSSYMLMQLAI